MLSSVTFCGEAAELGRASDARLLPDAKEEAAVELLRVPDDRRLRVANEAVAVIRLRAMAHRRAAGGSRVMVGVGAPQAVRACIASARRRDA